MLFKFLSMTNHSVHVAFDFVAFLIIFATIHDANFIFFDRATLFVLVALGCHTLRTFYRTFGTTFALGFIACDFTFFVFFVTTSVYCTSTDFFLVKVASAFLISFGFFTCFWIKCCTSAASFISGSFLH